MAQLGIHTWMHNTGSVTKLVVHPACAWEGGQVWMGQQDTAPVLLKRRAGRNASCQICLMPNLRHACSPCALETLASEPSGQDAASPATKGDPPPLLRPKSQAGWQVQRKLLTWVSVWQGNESEQHTQCLFTPWDYPNTARTTPELRCNTT